MFFFEKPHLNQLTSKKLRVNRKQNIIEGGLRINKCFFTKQ